MQPVLHTCGLPISLTCENERQGSRGIGEKEVVRSCHVTWMIQPAPMGTALSVFWCRCLDAGNQSDYSGRMYRW